MAGATLHVGWRLGAETVHDVRNDSVETLDKLVVRLLRAVSYTHLTLPTNREV